MKVWLLASAVLLMKPASQAMLYSSSTPCGPCRCWNNEVDCSNLQLTMVPDNGLPVSATSLNLRNNSIVSLPPGTFGRFSSLRHIDLSHNLIDNLTRETFLGLERLLQLNLADNKLAFERMSQTPFANLISLQHLDLSHNFLSDMGLDIFFGLGRSLLWLDLSFNKFIASERALLFGSLVNIAFLDLSNNCLISLHQDLFKNLLHLRWLNLSHNELPLNEDAYQEDVFNSLGSSLLSLRLEGNCNAKASPGNLSYPDRALSELHSLQSLYIDGLPNVNFGPGFRNMTSLQNMSLSGIDGGFCSLNSLVNDTFVDVPHSLRLLNISGCNIGRIEMEAFKPLGQLTVLDVSSNLDLGFETLGKAFYSLQGSALKELYINSIIHPYAMCTMVTPQNTENFKNTSLEVIHAKNNRLEAFCEGALQNMPESLKIVSLDGNDLGFGSYIKDLGSLKNLSILHNDGHRTALAPPTDYPPDYIQQCSVPLDDTTRTSMACHRLWHPGDFPSDNWVTSVSEISPRGPSKLVYTLPPELQTYISRWDKLYLMILAMDFNPQNKLTILNLSNNLLTTWIGPVTGLNQVHTLDLANNFAHNVSYCFFESFRSLKVLNVSRNFLRVIIENDTSGKLFRPLENLEDLYISKNYLNVIPHHTFHGLVNLRKLVLSQNEIFKFEVNISHMKNLSLLDLAYNNIYFLPQFVMDHLDSVAEYQNVTVNLTFNPIACICKHIHFLTWIQNSKVTFPDINSYSCLWEDGSVQKMTNIFDVIEDLQKSCTDKSGFLAASISCLFCLLLAILAAVLYRFRWRLRYLYYASRLAYSRHDTSVSEDFAFDAFVSYSSEDNSFVHGQLIDELETGAGLRLLVHNRDFTPGRPIPCNIVDAVQSSRRTLVVLSRELLKSDWCHYEMQMATMEATQRGRDVLLFLLYEDVPPNELPRDVLYNLQSCTHITFPSHAEPQLVQDFWKRLAQAIKQS